VIGVDEALRPTGPNERTGEPRDAPREARGEFGTLRSAFIGDATAFRDALIPRQSSPRPRADLSLLLLTQPELENPNAESFRVALGFAFQIASTRTQVGHVYSPGSFALLRVGSRRSSVVLLPKVYTTSLVRDPGAGHTPISWRHTPGDLLEKRTLRQKGHSRPFLAPKNVKKDVDGRILILLRYGCPRPPRGTLPQYRRGFAISRSRGGRFSLIAAIAS
jgi:hypothetical protein